jgi:urocanate hydratase
MSSGGDWVLGKVMNRDGVIRHSDAGYELAKETAKKNGLDIIERF